MVWKLQISSLILNLPRCCCTSLHSPPSSRRLTHPHICYWGKPEHKRLILSKTAKIFKRKWIVLRRVSLRQFYLIRRTFRATRHHVQVSHLIVVHGEFALFDVHCVVARPFPCDRLASFLTKHRSALNIPTQNKSINPELCGASSSLWIQGEWRMVTRTVEHNEWSRICSSHSWRLPRHAGSGWNINLVPPGPLEEGTEGKLRVNLSFSVGLRLYILTSAILMHLRAHGFSSIFKF